MPPRSTFDVVRERQPKCCPDCTSPLIAPLFEGEWWDCAACDFRWENI